jgi:uncharacterized protein
LRCVGVVGWAAGSCRGRQLGLVRDHDAPALDRPWRRPGASSYVPIRVRAFVKPPIDVYEPPADLVIEHDVAVSIRDGTILRVDVYRPSGAGRFPTLLCVHPYGKDRVPVKRRRGYKISFQFSVLRQTGKFRFSTLTSWEAPDPAWWVAQGYAVVNCDLRGAGTSEGTSALLSDGEGEDVHDLIEWAGARPWCSGVGMIGVSYLAISQWKAAALRPPSLRAICPWEGFTDAYRDLLRPGGIREDGFTRIWSAGLHGVRQKYSIRAEQKRRPTRDAFYRALVPDLERIEVPTLVCGSFSDNNLHTRGSFRGYEQISSSDKFLYTHRGGKWSTFYSDEAKRVQLAFFDRYLKGDDVPPPPPVRLEVRESRLQIAETRDEQEWPLARTAWTPLYFTNTGLARDAPTSSGAITFGTRSRGVRIGWTVRSDTELTGPMSLRLFVSVQNTDDVSLFAGVEKWRGRSYVPFEGSYGYGRDRVTSGWQKASLRALDDAQSRPFEPVPTLADPQPLAPDVIVQVDIALGPSATLFRAGEQLRLVVAGRWLAPRNPLFGGFPAWYQQSARGRCTLHWGPEHRAQLLVPVIDS